MVLFFLISNTNLLDTCLVPALPGWGAQKCPKIVPVLQPWRGGREELGNSPADSQDPREPCNPHSRPAGLEGEPGWSVAEKDHRGEEQGECEGRAQGHQEALPVEGTASAKARGWEMHILALLLQERLPQGPTEGQVLTRDCRMAWLVAFMQESSGKEHSPSQ